MWKGMFIQLLFCFLSISQPMFMGNFAYFLEQIKALSSRSFAVVNFLDVFIREWGKLCNGGVVAGILTEW